MKLDLSTLEGGPPRRPVRAGATFTAAYFLPDELASIGDVFPPGVAARDRYADMSLLNR